MQQKMLTIPFCLAFTVPSNLNQKSRNKDDQGTPNQQIETDTHSKVVGKRHYLLNEAREAKRNGKYKSMAKAMNDLARLDGSLDKAERELLSEAYENLVTPIVNKLHRDDMIKIYNKDGWTDYTRKIYDVKGDRGVVMETAEREKMLQELHVLCKEVLDLLEDVLIPGTDTIIRKEDGKDVSEEMMKGIVTRSFYLHMQSDYYSILVNYLPADKRKSNQAKESDYIFSTINHYIQIVKKLVPLANKQMAGKSTIDDVCKIIDTKPSLSKCPNVRQSSVQNSCPPPEPFISWMERYACKEYTKM